MADTNLQAHVIALLSDPETHGLAGRSVARLDTHASAIFFAGEWVYKLKHAVRYPFLDFSTLKQRERACAAELRLNRRTAPDLYLGVCPVIRTGNGGLALGPLQADGPVAAGNAEVVDWLVVMRRFDQTALLSQQADAGTLKVADMPQLAANVAKLHTNAESVTAHGSEALASIVRGNDAAFRQRPDLFDPAAVAAFTAACHDWLASRRSLLDRRAADGLVRRCHGDLHLGNIVMLGGEPTPFDAIEFDAGLAETDVLYDLAFLLMDLDQRGLAAHANRVLNSYLDHRDDLEGLAAMPLFLALRAGIRAKVASLATENQPDAESRAARAGEAERYFAAARQYLDPPPARLVAIGGMSGTGKTTVACRLAPGLGAVPGAVVVRSDAERKRLFGVHETERLPESAYDGRINADVYARVFDRATRAVAAGRAVVIEATFLGRNDRARARSAAESAGAPFHGVWLDAPVETLKARVAERVGDASDATPDVVEAQRRRAPASETAWPRVAADRDPDSVVASVRSVIGDTRKGR